MEECCEKHLDEDSLEFEAMKIAVRALSKLKPDQLQRALDYLNKRFLVDDAEGMYPVAEDMDYIQRRDEARRQALTDLFHRVSDGALSGTKYGIPFRSSGGMKYGIPF
jgi:hypothetical protein